MQSPTPTQSEASLHAVDYWQVIKNRYGVILLTLLLVFMTAAVITYVMPKKYESTAKIEVKPPTPSMYALGKNFSDTSGMNQMTQSFFANQLEILRSRKVMQKVSERLQLPTKWGCDPETAMSILSGIVDSQNTRGTDFIVIKVRHQNKEMACDIAAAAAEAYKDYRTGLEGDVAQRGLSELNKALRDQADKVEELRKQRDTIVKTRQIIPSGPESIYRTPMNEDGGAQSASETYSKLEQEKIQLESQIDNLLTYSSDQLMVYASGLDLPENVIKAMYPQFLEQKRLLDSTRQGGLGERHPTVQAMQKNLDTMRSQMLEGVANLRDTLRAQLTLAEARLKKFEVLKDEKKGEAINKVLDSVEYVDANREYEHASEMLQEMRLKFYAEKIQERMPEDPIKIHEEPVIGQSPVSPNVTLNLILGAVVGLVFGVGIAFFLEYLDTSVKSLEDVERYLQVPVLAVVPKDVGVLFKQGGMSPDAEAYRILRTNIEFNRKNPEDNSITVVSGGAGEGKSTTLVNLAYICAQGGYTTLMIDADLRRPRLHTFFDINNSVGLTNYLTTELMLEDVILQTPVDNLYFMPSGILPSDAAGILNSRRMSELIQDVKQRFDLVLVDSPPILGVSDASVLASEVDLTMIVVQHRKLPRNMLLRVKQAVENVGGHVIGVVLNNVDVRSDSQYQYYTSYYTYYAPAESQPTAQTSTPSPAPASKPAAKGGKTEEGDLY